jgi:hypothetical protein
MYKKILTLILLAAALSLPVVTHAMVNSIQSLSIAIANVAWVVFTAIAVICFIYAAILFLSAGGQPEKVQAAKSSFVWGVAGVIVGILAYSIINIVSNVLQ